MDKYKNIRYKNVDILTKNGSITKLLVTLEWSGMFKISSFLKKNMDLNDFECLSYFRIGSNTFCGIQMFLQKKTLNKPQAINSVLSCL